MDIVQSRACKGKKTYYIVSKYLLVLNSAYKNRNRGQKGTPTSQIQKVGLGLGHPRRGYELSSGRVELKVD
jgi:hypothetical protein